MGIMDDFLTEDLFDITEEVREVVKKLLEDPEGIDFSDDYEFEDEEIISADVSIIYPATGRRVETVKTFKVNVTVTVTEE